MDRELILEKAIITAKAARHTEPLVASLGSDEEVAELARRDVRRWFSSVRRSVPANDQDARIRDLAKGLGGVAPLPAYTRFTQILSEVVESSDVR